MFDLSDIRRLLRRAGRRLAAERFLRALHVSGLVAAVVALVLAGVDRAGAAPFVPWLWTAGGLGVLAIAAAVVRQRLDRPDELTVAVLVDERLGLRERLSNALQASTADDGIARVVVEDGLAAARDPRVRQSVERGFTIRGPRTGWLAPVIALLAFGVLQLPQASLLAADSVDEEQAAAAAAARTEAEATVATVARALEESPELSEHLSDLADDLAMPEDLATALDDPEDVRREAIKRLTNASQRLEELLDGQDAAAMRSLETMMSRLEPVDGAARELSQAMREGDFAKAADALQQLMEQLETGEMTDQQAQELGEQLQQLAEQVQELAEQQEALEQALAEAGLDPQLANNPAAMQQAIQQADGLNEQQKQQLQQQAAAMQQAQQMAKQMAGACQGMAQAMDGSQPGQMQGAAGAMGQQLSQLEAMQQMLSQASSMLSQCKGGGQAMGNSAMGQAMSPRGGQRGSGAASNPVSAAPGQTVQQREETQVRQGEVIARMLVDGEPMRGESKAALREVVRAATTGFDESVEESPLPRRYHDSIKHYFGRLQKQVEAAPVQEGAAAGGASGAPGPSDAPRTPAASGELDGDS